VSAVQSALRARRRQYQVRDLLRQREEADRRKDEFLAMLSHELRNPLSPILMGARLLSARFGDDPGAGRQVEIISRQATHMARLLDDLLDISRITRGKIELKKAPMDLLDALAQAVESSRPLINERRHHLRLNLPTKPVLVEADETRLQQIFTNLLNNAAHYTPPGGEVTVSAWVEDGTAVVSVRDTGEGIAPELQPYLFGLFVQGPRSLARSEGLTMVKRLAELHGGEVGVWSEGPGKGSEFTVRLPLWQSPAPAGVA